MNKLEIKYLIPYLDYNLKIFIENNIKSIELIGLMIKSGYSNESLCIIDEDNGDEFYIADVKPVLKNLNNYKDINSKSMNELNIDLPDQMTISELANGFIHVNSVNLGAIEIMAENHIDFNRLIELNLAIDINKLK